MMTSLEEQAEEKAKDLNCLIFELRQDKHVADSTVRRLEAIRTTFNELLDSFKGWG
jgi:hypothetical protein